MTTEKPVRERLTELTGSMLLAAIVVSVVSLPILLLGTGQMTVEQYVWLAMVGTLGSWSVMVPAKFFEGKVEDQAPRRFTQLVLGLAVGFVAWGLADALLVDLPLNRDMNAGHDSLVSQMLPEFERGVYDSGQNVPLALFVGYFGFLFMALRWWTQAEWTRHTRLSIWSIAVSVVAALLLQMLWWFPQPSGAMVAAVMAVSIQLASPWLSLSRRREIVQKLNTT